jgi:hypothetical protein
MGTQEEVPAQRHRCIATDAPNRSGAVPGIRGCVRARGIRIKSMGRSLTIVFATPATNAGCPFQAFCWLEWDNGSRCATSRFSTTARQKQFGCRVPGSPTSGGKWAHKRSSHADSLAPGVLHRYSVRTFPQRPLKIKFLHAQGTTPFNNNPADAITGFYVDANNLAHGFLRTS